MKPNTLLAIFFIACIAGFVACNQDDKKEDDHKMSSDNGEARKLELAKSFYPLFEKGDWAGIEKLVAPDFKEHNAMMTSENYNRDSLMKYLKMNKEAFPDMKIEALHAAADGDLVFIHYHFTGTNTGSMMGMPATNKKVDYMGVDLVRIKDSVATEHWDYGDNVTFMKQMGMMPDQK